MKTYLGEIMIIDKLYCSSMSREMTNLMRSYGIEILTIENSNDTLEVSYRANYIHENKEFQELIKALPEVSCQTFLIWSFVAREYQDLFTENKRYEIIGTHEGMVQVLNDNDDSMLVARDMSGYGDNYTVKS